MSLALPSSTGGARELTFFQLHDERVIAFRQESNLHREFYQPCHSLPPPLPSTPPKKKMGYKT